MTGSCHLEPHEFAVSTLFNPVICYPQLLSSETARASLHGKEHSLTAVCEKILLPRNILSEENLYGTASRAT